MPFDGSNTYSPPAGTLPVIFNTIIDPDKFNALMNDVSAALTLAKQQAASVVAGANATTSEVVTARGVFASLVARLNAVDTAFNTKLSLTGGALSGFVTGPAGASGTQLVNFAQVESMIAAAVVSSIPAGVMAYWPMATPPTGWLKRNGAAVSRTTYSALFAAIGTFYGAGDGSTTFNVPDDRGEFGRTLDDGRGIDVSRTVGSAQAGAMPAHTHTYFAQVGNLGAGTISGAPLEYELVAGADKTTSSTGTGSEVRTRNMAWLGIIKF